MLHAKFDINLLTTYKVKVKNIWLTFIVDTMYLSID